MDGYKDFAPGESPTHSCQSSFALWSNRTRDLPTGELVSQNGEIGGFNFMDALTTKNQPTEDHDLKPEQSVRSSEGRSLVRLFRTAVFGLLSAVAAIFTTMLPMPDSWRSFWLIICVFALAVAVTGIVMFERSYKR
jgi:hypothetical protein